MNILVLGASGYIGTNLVPRLRDQGHNVRAGARNIEVLKAKNWLDVDLVEVDALVTDTITKALVDIDVVYYLIHSMSAGSHFKELEKQCAQNFVQAANQASLIRIIYLGGLLPKSGSSPHLASRMMTGELLRTGETAVIELRAGMIVGPGSAAFEVIRDLVNNLPVMLTPKWVKSKSPPIALDNLLTYLLHSAVTKEMDGGIFDLAGPEMLTYRQLMTQFGELVGKKTKIIPVPVLSPNLSALWLRLVTTVPTNIAKALIAGLKEDIEANDDSVRKLIPQRLLTFEQSVLAVFEAETKNEVAARWTEGVLQMRGYNKAYAFYAKKACGSAVADANLAAVWRHVTAIGGDNRYYYLDWAWTVREFLDWAIGGPGRNRGRRSETDVRIGDMVDSWRVIAVQPQHTLTLMMGMKAPGAGVLEFELEAISPTKTKLTATAYWHPAGLPGLLYWYSLIPAHGLIFDGMTAKIAALAEAEYSANQR